MDTDVEKRRRSFSQLSQYEKCPLSYKLARIDKVWKRPAAWLYQGSAVHAAIEALEKSGRTMTRDEVKDVFRAEYAALVEEACKETPNFEYWFWSGPYNGMQDVERRYGIGLEQIDKYFDWIAKHPEERVWVAPDGTLGIELEFDVEIGGVRVTGFIDKVIDRDGRPEPEDVKTGNRPGDPLQLGVYGVALKLKYPEIPTPEAGTFWMGKSGLSTKPIKLGQWTAETVGEAFAELEANIQAGKFEARPEPDKCKMCDVARACPIYN